MIDIYIVGPPCRASVAVAGTPIFFFFFFLFPQHYLSGTVCCQKRLLLVSQNVTDLELGRFSPSDFMNYLLSFLSQFFFFFFFFGLG